MGFLSSLFKIKGATIAAQAVDDSDEAVLLVDVRERDEFEGGHAPQARHVPLSELDSSLGELRADGRLVAFVCRSGMRSATAAKKARLAGLEASSVSGGMQAWGEAGLPIVAGSEQHP
ncbi:MAG: rhodanese-like domain-containing protein [Thermoleophilaceae bacterium]